MTRDEVVGDQKFHEGTIPRVGGIGLFFGLIIGFILSAPSVLLQQILISLTPIFLVGLLEDLFKSVSSTIRLFISLFSAFSVVFLTGYHFSSSGIHVLDVLLQFPFLWLIVTIIALAALANGINIIDGFNGLSIVFSLSMVISIGVLGYSSGDHYVF